MVFSPDGQHLLVASDQNIRIVKFSQGTTALRIEMKAQKEGDNSLYVNVLSRNIESKLVALFFSSNETILSVRRSTLAGYQLPSGKNIAQTATANFCEGMRNRNNICLLIPINMIKAL